MDYIVELEESWDLILSSYCISNDGHEDGNWDHIGEGCGDEHYYYNASLSNDEVIEIGDGLDISGIANLAGRV